MTFEIIQSPAQQQTARIEENFGEFAQRIRTSTRRELRFGDGKRIEIMPDRILCCIGIEVEHVATPEQFANLMAAIMLTVEQFEAQKLLPVNWVKRVGTLVDFTPPAIPQCHLDTVEANGGTVKTYLDGMTFFDIVPEYPEQNTEDRIQETE